MPSTAKEPGSGTAVGALNLARNCGSRKPEDRGVAGRQAVGRDAADIEEEIGAIIDRADNARNIRSTNIGEQHETNRVAEAVQDDPLIAGRTAGHACCDGAQLFGSGARWIEDRLLFVEPQMKRS